MTIFTISSLTPYHQRARNRSIVGIVLSILIHVALFWVIWNSLDSVTPPPAAVTAPLQVSLVQRKPVAAVKQPEPPKLKPVTKPVTKPKSPPPRQVALAPSRSTSPHSLPVAPNAITRAPPEMDMSTMINAARERRHAAEASAAEENSAARAVEQGPSDNDVARDNIAFQERRANGATNGVFEITSKGPRIAQYVFRGWTTDARHSKAQTITVDAGLNGDVDKAIVDSMIKLIRQYYKADFTWNSFRLGHSVTLSAREEDTAGLRQFLLRDVFDDK